MADKKVDEASAGTRAHAPIYVTKAVVPDPVEYSGHIMRILDSRHLTNYGIYARELEAELRQYLDVPHLALCTNGTLALQLAIRAAGLQGREVITTPFSYVATVSALLWEGCTPVFADIDEESLCLDPKALANAGTDAAAGVLPVHIYGNACDVEGIGQVAEERGLTVLYDGAQAFGSVYRGKSLLCSGDMATASFHATKVFHTVEGGCVICRTPEAHRALTLLRAFGHEGDDHQCLGINAKITEPHAAMGLCLLPKAKEQIAARERASRAYDALLPALGVRKPLLRAGLDAYNYAYYPLVFDTERCLRRALESLNRENVFPRRYFFPSLNTLPYLPARQACPVAESAASRVLCLPLYGELAEADIERIMRIVARSL